MGRVLAGEEGQANRGGYGGGREGHALRNEWHFAIITMCRESVGGGEGSMWQNGLGSH